jgi:branched-chain amino acid transport system permease protein
MEWKSPFLGNSGKMIKSGVWAGLLIILLMCPLFVKSPYLIHIFNLTFIYIIVAVSFRTIMTSGQLPLSHAGFMGVGAYTSAVAAIWLDLTPWITIPFGALVAMGIGVIMGYPFARLRTVYYAMISLFFGILIISSVKAFETWTGGAAGLTGIPTLLGFSKIPYYYFFLGLTSVCLLVLHRFEFSRTGLTWKAIAQSYQVAASVGINEARYRILASAIGCLFSGLAGATYAHYNGVIGITSFSLMSTILLLIYVIIGGVGSFFGPIIGVVLLMTIPELLRGLREYVPYISAAILLIVVYLMPKGAAGLANSFISWFTEFRKNRRTSDAS